jgi:predicted RNA binding protein YcfA (HicA-like mRNA interferase family)
MPKQMRLSLHNRSLYPPSQQDQLSDLNSVQTPRICGSLRKYRSRYVAAMKIRDVLKLLRNDGWREVAMRGSHRQLEHRFKPARVTVAGNAHDDLAKGTLNSILKQAGLRR